LTSGYPNLHNAQLKKNRSADGPGVQLVSTPVFHKIPALTSSKNVSEGDGKTNTADAKMTTSANNDKAGHVDAPDGASRVPRLVQSIFRARFTRELLIVLAFFVLTSLLTWPYVSRIRGAVSGRNDPYLTSYVLWWDYHATFNDPANLFHPNIFYPYRYALAFSEHCYGIALLFFPLFALGFKPLTVHAVAIFFGFILSGYGGFRLARTLTGQTGPGWIAGILFAFIPYRYGMIGQLMYLFSAWVPLIFEALVLFVREQSRKRAAWLGVCFFMLGSSTTSWFLWSLIPLAVTGAILLTRYQLWLKLRFWKRLAIALGLGSLALMPFIVPYYLASRIYGFKRRIDEVRAHSATPMHWLAVDDHNQLWVGLGKGFYEAWKFQMFPGLLALLLPLAELLMIGPAKIKAEDHDQAHPRSNWIRLLDVLAVIAFAVSVLAIGFDGTGAYGLFQPGRITSERALAFLSIVVIARLCLAYPRVLRRGEGANLIETLRSQRRSDAFWMGVLLTVIGFFYSIGWNFFFYRILYDLMPGFKGIRAPMRGALFAYLGLSLLAGLGVMRLADLVGRHFRRIRPPVVFVIVSALLLFELNGAPFFFIRGEVYPDAITLRLKDTPMRGGIAYLPMSLDLNHQYTLRAADHLKPLITATSSFNPPLFDEIEKMTNAGTIPLQFMDLLERIPASYLIIENGLIEPGRKADYAVFLTSAVSAQRLRFVNRFDGKNDLYAVTRIEPGAKTEAPLPAELHLREWSSLIDEDQANILGRFRNWSQTLYRLHLAASGGIPRYADLMNDAKTIGRDVIEGQPTEQLQLETNLRRLVEEWVQRKDFIATFGQLDDERYVERLSANAGLNLDSGERAALIAGLSSRQETRGSVLLKIAAHPRLIDKEKNRSLTVLYYFAFLRRNPGDAPDYNLEGLAFWTQEFERHDPAQVMDAFKASGEYLDLQKKK
jgi:hypothetical protein